MDIGYIIMTIAIIGSIIRIFQWLNKKVDYSPKLTQEKAGMLIKSKNYIAAINILSISIDLYPRNGYLYYQRSFAFFESNQLEKASYDINRAFELEYWVRSSNVCQEHRRKIEEALEKMKTERRSKYK